MSDVGAIEAKDKEELAIPYGKRIVGIDNPQNMTEEEFSLSSEILFHGSKDPVNYDHNYHYDSDFYMTQDGSLTLGTGFYTTPDKIQAENYSYVRGAEGKILHVISLLPNKAVMLDLREKDSLKENAPLPKEIFDGWRERFVRYYKDQDKNLLPWYESQFLNEYLKHLDAMSQFSNIDLRSMLWTSSDKRLHDGFYPSPPWVELFSQFMREIGYDGVIYI